MATEKDAKGFPVLGGDAGKKQFVRNIRRA
jgi:hypothetical protein